LEQAKRQVDGGLVHAQHLDRLVESFVLGPGVVGDLDGHAEGLGGAILPYLDAGWEGHGGERAGVGDADRHLGVEAPGDLGFHPCLGKPDAFPLLFERVLFLLDQFWLVFARLPTIGSDPLRQGVPGELECAADGAGGFPSLEEGAGLGAGLGVLSHGGRFPRRG
jgi:hypothetical protein